MHVSIRYGATFVRRTEKLFPSCSRARTKILSSNVTFYKIDSRILELPGLLGLIASVHAVSEGLHLPLREALFGLHVPGGLHLLVFRIAEHVQDQRHCDLLAPIGQQG